MKYKKHFLYLLIVTILLEVLLFNYKFWLTRTNEVITPDVTLADGTPLQYGTPYCLTDGLTLNITGVDTKVSNVYLGIQDIYLDKKKMTEYKKEINNVLSANISISDDGSTPLYYIQKYIVSPLYRTSQYLSLEAFGDTHDIQITIDADKKKYVIFNQISLNEKVCFDINPLRMMVFYIILLSIYSFIFGSYESSDYEGKKVFCKTFCVFIITTIAMLSLLYLVREQKVPTGCGYHDLARALTEGRLWVEENTDEILETMDNPYSAADRNMMGAKVNSDTAYYNGYYYIYFGITPALIFFLPYYLITGQDMTYFQAESIIIIIITLCGFILVDQIRRRIAPKTPWKITMLMSVIMATLSGVILMVKRTQIYYTAIGTALMLVLIGLCLWMSAAARFDKGDKKSALITGMLGSLSMALAVGSRPQFAMASFLAFAIFIELFKKFGDSWKQILLLILPYIPVAAFLMWYNYARFDSPFDFGANYNMTGYDMTHMGIHASRTLVGIWYYVFNLPRLHIEFPYIIAESITTNYPGFMAAELQIGGAVALMPVCWILVLLAGKKYRKQFQTTNRKYDSNMLMCYISIGSALIIVIADTIMCGILMRYQMDYRIYLLLAAVITTFMWIKSAENKENVHKIYKVVACLGLITIMFGIFTITAQYENPDYSVPTGCLTSIYLRIKGIFGY